MFRLSSTNTYPAFGSSWMVRSILPWQERYSQVTGSSILDTGESEVTHDVGGQLKQLQQEGMNPVGQLIVVVGQTDPVDVALQVIVQVLDRVQFRGPPWQEKHSDAV